MAITNSLINLAEKGILPDSFIRLGIRKLVQERISEISATNCETASVLEHAFVAMMQDSPIAPVPELANEQHYEVPAEFFKHCLGEHRKYSCCYWDDATSNLDQAEAHALKLTCEHADIADGQLILELGCGWGSLSLWMAKQFPNSLITGISNSNSQRQYIEKTARERGLNNLRIITCDMNNFRPEDFDIHHKFDRVVSVEMFEHMRNYAKIYSNIAIWLKPGGKFFKHIFVHRLVPYTFEVRDTSDWMSQYFFSGGIMPSDNLPLRFQDHLKLIQQWRWDGTHYERTANAWLENMDANYASVKTMLTETYGIDNLSMWRMRWRIFYMACAELFGYNRGQEWWVSHYLFEKPLQ